MIPQILAAISALKQIKSGNKQKAKTIMDYVNASSYNNEEEEKKNGIFRG